MASGGVTTTGLAEAKAASRRLPAAVTAALRGVARATALRVQARARRLVRKDTGLTERSIVVMPDEPGQRYLVAARGDTRARTGRMGDRPANIPLWIEEGTRKSRKPKSRAMPARQFMRPSLKAEDAQYRRDMAAASERAARETLGA
ncbi:MAG: hypothetical protein AB7Q29_14785 [Vicinamibacterales bacterium]